MTDTRQSLAALLPCPFCGNSKGLAVANENPQDLSGGYFIACPSCDASTGLRFACGEDPIPLLIEQWNRRAALAAQPVAGAVAEPTLPVEIYGKFYEVPIPVQVHIVALEQKAAPAPEPSRSQKMREAGFIARDTRLTCDECGAKFTPQFAPLHECAQPEPSAQGEQVATVTEKMVTAYLTANDAYWKRIDGEPTKIGKWRNGTPSEATRVSLMAALASAPSTPPHAVVEAVPLTDEQADALRRLWPAIEKAMGCLVFTAEQAGAVQADMNTVRHGIAPKAAQEKP